MVDPRAPLPEQVKRQSKIIDALVRRASQQKDVGPSAYRAFQSAIDLQQQVAAQTLELESARYERERTRKALVEALASMEEGFALFTDGRLNICNELFKELLPDISGMVVPQLELKLYFDLMVNSRFLVSTNSKLDIVSKALEEAGPSDPAVSIVAELLRDRWYQLSVQKTSPENTVLLLTEITTLVQHNRREKENLIDQQEDYLQAVFQNMSAGVCTFSAEGQVMMHNGRFGDILGVPLSALQPGTPVQSLLSYMTHRNLIEDSVLAQMEAWQQDMVNKGSLSRRVPHGGGRVLDVYANLLPDGHFLVELKDVTLEARSTELLENRVMERTAELTRANAELTSQYEEKARVEEELRIAKERAEAAVSSKTRFLAAASHDLLQPINAAKLLISTLEETTRETRFLPMVERLGGAFASAEYLLHSLLDISRLESADPDMVSPSDVNLGAIMMGVKSDQMLLAEQKSVQLDVVPSSVFVRSDPVYLLRSVQNLVVNAIQYTNVGGRVLFGCRRKGDKIILEVWDTGIGIRRRDQARIFDEFTRAENVPIGSGVGLGLSVVDRACRLLGHRLSVRSKPGLGSVFSIEMDIVHSATPVAAQHIPVRELEAESVDHIVVVIENDADVLYGTTQWLEQWGASVLSASSTQQAVEFVKDMGMAPDIILADYQLDGADTGIRAIAEIRAMTGTQVPAILVTADRSETVRRTGEQNNISVMTKPADLLRLRGLIEWKIRSNAPPTDRSGQTKQEV
ncbi:PAS-domain containing protein [Sulfitobacter sp. CW3]|uniref:hybrid sensor histidine kinase/response regulator n=1 Tax=Sulfitobacter sp. CW3 TaxID=2861965 RepID=UPI001C5E5D4C|nr:PAS-domain containing protein [Sulfitobacter sp. CW3]MBW4962352.1 PAS-domain containing protein [Sulfitobacter sp. CW3]